MKAANPYSTLIYKGYFCQKMQGEEKEEMKENIFWAAFPMHN